MRIVIDISKDRYDEIMSMDWKNCRRFFDEEIRAIHDGKALVQEPCEDCISRDAVWEVMQRMWGTSGELLDELMTLPSVNPQEPKTGHWIKSQDCYGNNHFTCSCCGHDIATKADIWGDNYCSNCGCRMESEVNE